MDPGFSKWGTNGDVRPHGHSKGEGVRGSADAGVS